MNGYRNYGPYAHCDDWVLAEDRDYQRLTTALRYLKQNLLNWKGLGGHDLYLYPQIAQEANAVFVAYSGLLERARPQRMLCESCGAIGPYRPGGLS